MKISAKVTPSAKIEKIEKTKGGNFNISVKAPPVKGMANQAVIKLLASYFGVSASQVKIISGQFSRQKTINIIE